MRKESIDMILNQEQKQNTNQQIMNKYTSWNRKKSRLKKYSSKGNTKHTKGYVYNSLNKKLEII